MTYFKHDLSDVHSSNIGSSTNIWQFVIILKDAIIGSNCNINSNVFIENDVMIGDNVTIKCGVQIWDGTIIEDNVFVGPNVTFTNDLLPRSKKYPEKFETIRLRRGSSIGANATLIGSIDIGEYAMIGAGSVVTKNVAANELWVGNPARKIGYVTDSNKILDLKFYSKRDSVQYSWINNKLTISND